MKATLQFDDRGSSTILTLTPENAQDEQHVKTFAEQTKRTRIITCRGYKYMAKAVEFIVQPYPSSD